MIFASSGGFWNVSRREAVQLGWSPEWIPGGIGELPQWHGSRSKTRNSNYRVASSHWSAGVLLPYRCPYPQHAHLSNLTAIKSIYLISCYYLGRKSSHSTYFSSSSSSASSFVFFLLLFLPAKKCVARLTQCSSANSSRLFCNVWYSKQP